MARLPWPVGIPGERVVWAGAAPGLGSGGAWRGSSIRRSAVNPRLFARFRTVTRLFHLFICLQCIPEKCRRSCPRWRRSATNLRRGGSTRTRHPGLSPPLSWEVAKLSEAFDVGRLSLYRPCQLLVPAGRRPAPRGIPGG